MHEDHGSLWDRYLDLITDPAHLLLEGTLVLVIDVVVGLVLWPLIKRFSRRYLDAYHVIHDAEHHHGHTSKGED